jgi:hypothetical protein
MNNIKEEINSKEITGNVAYELGYRYVFNRQYGETLYTIVPKYGWGSGCWELLENGDKGKCINWDYDSSD